MIIRCSICTCLSDYCLLFLLDYNLLVRLLLAFLILYLSLRWMVIGFFHFSLVRGFARGCVCVLKMCVVSVWRQVSCCTWSQYVAVCCSMLQYIAVCCSMLQRVAVVRFENGIVSYWRWVSDIDDECVVTVYCSVLQYVAVCCIALQCVSLLLTTSVLLQYIAACCSTLQYVAARCSTRVSYWRRFMCLLWLPHIPCNHCLWKIPSYNSHSWRPVSIKAHPSDPFICLT